MLEYQGDIPHRRHPAGRVPDRYLASVLTLFTHEVPMEDPKTRLEHMVKALEDNGHRVTSQRLAVAKVLAASTGHPDTATVFRQARRKHPSISLASVYKTIVLLKECRQVLELEFSERHNRYDGVRPSPHPHLICNRCGAIEDPLLPDLVEVTRRIGEETGYRIDTSRLDFFGLCPACRKKELDAEKNA